MAICHLSRGKKVDWSRLTLVLAAFSLIVLVITGLLIMATQSVHSGEEVNYGQVAVNPGDTLWQIAKRIAPKEDPREIVWEIRKLNQLETAIVYPGQILRVPVR